MSFSNDIRAAWLQPPAIYRSAPFWSWNGLLEGERLARSIRTMHAGGMGGFFMHSRYGLKTPFLSREWFDCVSTCVQTARELGMKAYLYDEDRWPSGTAGGAVTRDSPDDRAHYLAAVPADAEHPPEAIDTVGTFALRTDESGRLVEYVAIEDDQPAPEGYTAVHYDVCLAAPSGWYNDGTYLDTLNPDAVAQFIRLSYRSYGDRYDRDFGGLIPAIFTDEPNCCSLGVPREDGILRVPWTMALPRQFKKQSGYDLRDYLPELFAPLAKREFSQVRHDFYRTVTGLFVESYTQQIGRWCEKHQLALTGHMLWEDTLGWQVHCIGAAMPHYEHMQWPGIDVIPNVSDHLLTIKQCSSVAAQLGRERVLSELYGCTGWDWPLASHKSDGDWQYACGVNFRCPHLTHYTLAGGAKRDYPASLFSHSPWWPYYRRVEDYFARLSAVLTQGQPVRDVLVIHPVESAWGLYIAEQAPRQADGEDFRAIEGALREICHALTDHHLDWDFADESLLARHGKCGSGQLRMGQMSYSLVVVPPCATLRETTLEMLRRFAAAGGTVLLAGEGPAHVDGGTSEELPALLEAFIRCPAGGAGVVDAVESHLQRRLSIREDERECTDVRALLQRVSGGQMLFVQCSDRHRGRHLEIEALGQRPVVRWDPQTGRQVRVKSAVDGDRVRFEVDLPPCGSALLSLGVSCPDAVHPPHPPRRFDSEQIAGPFLIETTEPNSLPLDFCRYRIDGGELSAPTPTLRADIEIRERFGLGDRIGLAAQPWYLQKTGRLDERPLCRLEIRRRFHVTDVPMRCSLAVEAPQRMRITLNGEPVGADRGWWIDPDIRLLELPPLLEGENELVAEMDYTAQTELEDMFLLGDFGVRRLDAAGPWRAENLTVSAAPDTLKIGPWTDQGLPFYTGGVRYQLPRPKLSAGQRLRVLLGSPACTAAAVHVGDKTFALPFPPFEVDITDALTDAVQSLTVEIVGGRKNCLGPLHTPWMAWTGPLEFRPDHPQWTDEYLLSEHGLLSPVTFERVYE